ncbi:hypothetical protein [Campylobacter sp.]|nr:hypothetical protein [Campylobacter sp.]
MKLLRFARNDGGVMRSPDQVGDDIVENSRIPSFGCFAPPQ